MLQRHAAKRAGVPAQEIRATLVDDAILKLIQLDPGRTERAWRAEPELRSRGVGDRAIRGAIGRLKAEGLVIGRRKHRGARAPIRLYYKAPRDSSQFVALPDGMGKIRTRGKSGTVEGDTRRLLSAMGHAVAARIGLELMPGALGSKVELEDGRNLVAALDHAAGTAKAVLRGLVKRDIQGYDKGWRAFLKDGMLKIEMIDAPAQGNNSSGAKF